MVKASKPVSQVKTAAAGENGPQPKYLPTKDEQALMDEWLNRKRPSLPRITVRFEDDGTLATGNSHADETLGILLLMRALGLESTAEYTLFKKQIFGMVKCDATGEHIQRDVNEIVGLIAAHKPHGITEAMLCLQMVAVHLAINKAMMQVVNADHGEVRIANSDVVNKLTRTFTMQVDALKRHRSKGREQRVVVEHKHYNYVAPGAQAVFGDVTKAGDGGGVVQKSPPQSHGRKRTAPALTLVETVPAPFSLTKEIVAAAGGDEAA